MRAFKWSKQSWKIFNSLNENLPLIHWISLMYGWHMQLQISFASKIIFTDTTFERFQFFMYCFIMQYQSVFKWKIFLTFWTLMSTIFKNYTFNFWPVSFMDFFIGWVTFFSSIQKINFQTIIFQTKISYIFHLHYYE